MADTLYSINKKLKKLVKKNKTGNGVPVNELEKIFRKEWSFSLSHLASNLGFANISRLINRLSRDYKDIINYNGFIKFLNSINSFIPKCTSQIKNKMNLIPLRVLVESNDRNASKCCSTCSHDNQIILDTYAIINGNTKLNQLNETIMTTLGLQHLVQDSYGLIQIKNWKPLTLDSISDNPDETVFNMFKEVSNGVVFKILTSKHQKIQQQHQIESQQHSKLLFEQKSSHVVQHETQQQSTHNVGVFSNVSKGLTSSETKFKEEATIINNNNNNIPGADLKFTSLVVNNNPLPNFNFFSHSNNTERTMPLLPLPTKNSFEKKQKQNFPMGIVKKQWNNSQRDFSPSNRFSRNNNAMNNKMLRKRGGRGNSRQSTYLRRSVTPQSRSRSGSPLNQLDARRNYTNYLEREPSYSLSSKIRKESKYYEKYQHDNRQRSSSRTKNQLSSDNHRQKHKSNSSLSKQANNNNIEEQIDQLITNCCHERTPSKQASYIQQIIELYKNLGDAFELIKIDFDQKMEINDYINSEYDFSFAENFEDFWSYGILIYCNLESENEDIIRAALEIKLKDVWDTETEDRCNKALTMLGSVCSSPSIYNIQKIVFQVQSEDELEKCKAKTEWGNPRIICFKGDYCIAICGNTILLTGGISHAITFYVILHFVFGLRFSEDAYELLLIIMTLMGLNLPNQNYHAFTEKQLKLIKGSYLCILENEAKFEGRQVKKHLKWTSEILQRRHKGRTSSSSQVRSSLTKNAVEY